MSRCPGGSKMYVNIVYDSYLVVNVVNPVEHRGTLIVLAAINPRVVLKPRLTNPFPKLVMTPKPTLPHL
jgi:hypothetical protein